MLVSPTLSGEQRRMTQEALDLAPDIGHNRALLPPQERGTALGRGPLS